MSILPFHLRGRGCLLVAACTLWLTALGTVQARSSMTLTVQLRDTAQQPFAGATVRLFDAATGTPLGAQVTTDRGQAVFAELQPGAVRVVVAGVLADGTPLRQVGLDADGIRVELPRQAWQMELMADVDGAVVPELSLDGAGAADGADHTAIMEGTFGSTTTATPTPNRPPVPTAAAVGRGMEPAAASAPSSAELVSATAWMLVVCLAFVAVMRYGRRP